MRHLREKSGHSPRAVSVLAVVALAMSAVGIAPNASATLPRSPVLALERTVSTRPFAGSNVSIDDSEGSAYVPRDRSLWLADDDGESIYEIDLWTGAFKRRIPTRPFARAQELGGGARAGASRVAEIQALAYDPMTDALYAYSGQCCVSAPVISTAFRLTRKDGELKVDSYQSLPRGVQVEGAAWNPCDGRLYVGSHGRLWSHLYTTNRLEEQHFATDAIEHLYGLDFSDDGRYLFVAQPYTRVTRVDWATKTVTPGWDLDFAGLGPEDIRAVEVVGERLWVSDGSDTRSPDDPFDHALLVFGVGASGDVARTSIGSGKNLVGNPGFRRDVCGWDTEAARVSVALTRVAAGHSGRGAARVERIHGRGDMRLASVQTWEVRKKRKHIYTASLWVRSSTPGEKLRLRLRELYAGRYVESAKVSTIELTRSWKKVTVSLKSGGYARRIALDATVKNARKGTSFIADGARFQISRRALRRG
jgi:DNA-binding beta-propeller fold protein YncE